MTGTRSSPPLSPLRPDSPHRALHTELLIHPFSSRAQVTGMLAGVERLRQVQQGAAALTRTSSGATGRAAARQWQQVASRASDRLLSL